MAKGRRCRICNEICYAQEESYQPMGNWVTYVCRNGGCQNLKRSGYPWKERVFEPK